MVFWIVGYVVWALLHFVAFCYIAKKRHEDLTLGYLVFFGILSCIPMIPTICLVGELLTNPATGRIDAIDRFWDVWDRKLW